MKVLISHPGRQNSDQAALALERAGLLAAYWAGVPSRDAQQSWIPRSIRRRFIRYAQVDIADERAKWLPIAVGLRRMGQWSHIPLAAQCLDLLACRAFDKQVAWRLGAAHASAVMASEISALDTFRAAKARGMGTILDAASFHFATQDRVYHTAEPAWMHKKIIRVKEAEIRLADHILTVSELARASYLEAGVESGRVHAVPLGADIELFRPDPELRAIRRGSGKFTFVFAGAMSRRKGVDLLLEAFSRLEQRLPGAAALLLIGPRADAAQLVDQCGYTSVKTLPPVALSELRRVYCQGDCFVLPSRHDSFGMVVAEAMACGLPAIVSDMVGAKNMIEEGVSGWVTPLEDVSALFERMTWCVCNRDAVAQMGPAARAAAERNRWELYRDRLASLIKRLLDTSN